MPRSGLSSVHDRTASAAAAEGLAVPRPAPSMPPLAYRAGARKTILANVDAKVRAEETIRRTVGAIVDLTQRKGTDAGGVPQPEARQGAAQESGPDVAPFETARTSVLETDPLLRLASRLGRVAAWSLDLRRSEATWSSEVMSIYEFQPDQEVTTDLLVSLAAHERRQAIGEAMHTCHVRGTPVDIEFPSSTAKGRRVWLRLLAEAVRDEAGAIVRVQGVVQDVTDRKQDAERLRLLTERLTATFESITDGFATLDRELRVTYVNREAERRSGLSRDMLIGRRLPELFPTFADSTFSREFERALREGTAGGTEAYSAALGRWLQVSVFPSGQGLALYMRDVTDSKKAQQEVILSEERYRLLFETSADGIIQMRPDGRIRRSNRAACAMFGRTEAQMQALRSAQLVSPCDQRLQSMVGERLRSGSARGELTMVRADGSTFEAEVNTSTFKNRDGQSIANLVIRDATERIALRQKLIALNDELSEKVRQRTFELESANSELRGFARSLAHDMRQPIAAIGSLGFALEAALAKDDKDTARRHAGSIGEATRWMGDYVVALLGLTRISQAILKPEEVDLSSLATGLLRELQEQDPGRSVRVHVQPQVRANGDLTLLRLLLQNLLGNAWKFTSRREGALISFAAGTSPEGEVVYSVKDNGAGFDLGRAQRLFETFQRFHDSSEYPGTGIGLANAHRIVQRHGGRIWAESTPGAGATFHFTLARA